MTASSRRRESVQAPCVAGFDYGTSHCSIGLWRDGAVQMVPLQGEQTLVESTLYAPMAAALDYESRLDCDQRVLVVDIGGGTTDCSFLKVGPQRARQKDRNRDILGHAGERLGGNDYDQLFGLHTVMPKLGFGDELKSGLPIPNTYYVDALAVNDVNAQQRFYSRDAGERLDVFVRDAVVPQRLARLRRLRDGRSTYRLLRQIELGKITLSDYDQASVDLTFLETGLEVDCSRRQLQQSTARLLAHLESLISEVRAQAQVEPDAVYLTGGMARSTVVRDHLRRICGDRPLVDSDHFAAVTAGLTLWAARHFALD